MNNSKMQLDGVQDDDLEANTESYNISNDSLIRLSSLMTLFQVSISGWQESWDCDDLDPQVESTCSVPDETLEIIKSTAILLIKSAFHKHIASDEGEPNSDSWSYEVSTCHQGVQVGVSYSINGENESGHEIELHDSDTFQEEIKPLLDELKVARIEMEYSGGGDSGGTDRFEVLDSKGTILSVGVPAKIENWFENIVWNHVDANFNDSGSRGDASLDCSSDHPTIVCSHVDYFDDSKSFEELFTIED